ncbi:MAG: hypothetical protein R2748_02725 [Bryobacterales bacterium]
MPRFSSGVHVEDRLVALLERFGCRIQRDEILDHRHLLDFVVLELPEFQTLLSQPIGVQVTGRLGDLEKQRRFQERVESSPYTRKNFYVEIDRETDLERGGAFALLVAIADYALQRELHGAKTRGLRVFADNSFEFFSLDENSSARTASLMLVRAAGMADPGPIKRTPGEPLPPGPVAEASAANGSAPRPSVPGPPNPVMGQRLSAALGRSSAPEASRIGGVVARYNPGNLMGVIRSDGGQEYFLHRNNIIDDALRSLLERIADEGGQWIADRDVRVSFLDGGKPYGKKNHIAQEIRTDAAGEAAEPEVEF